MTIPEQLIDQAAEMLREAQSNRTPCPPIREFLGTSAGEAEAYAIQEANTRRAIRDGRRLVGRKIGLTSTSVQRQLGVSQPDSGMLFADMCLQDSQPASFDRLLQPKAEAEIALVLERDVTAEQPIVSDLIRAIGYVVPAIEIVDSRISDWNIRLVDTVADNASSGLFVLGGPARKLDGLDLSACRMELWSTDGATGNARRMSQGRGRDCLGNPLNAAVWLARKMIEIGRPLVAGDVIMTGALGPMAAVSRGVSVRVSIEGIGGVEVAFA
jgi:2-keto-4-pentenoate hydratase